MTKSRGWRRIFWITVGVVMTSVGLAGLFPFMPGGALFLPGVGILAAEIPWVRRYIDQFKGWFEQRADAWEIFFGHRFPRAYPVVKVRTFQEAFYWQCLYRLLFTM